MIAAVVGFLLGGVPTAEWIARSRGIDLRASGSGNPGANNARRVGGAKLGVLVLAAEVVKGIVAVAATASLWGAPESVAAGVAAVAGNVAGPYRRLRGGQGLGITFGVLLAAWPAFTPIAVIVIAAVSAATRSAAPGALAAVAVTIASSIVWDRWNLPTPWGVDGPSLIWLAAGLGAIVAPKQIRNLIHDRRDRAGAV